MSSELQSPLEVARIAAQAAGEVVTRYFRDGVTMRSKDPYNLVSDADIDAERVIGETIHRFFPDHEILGEETYEGAADAEHLWVVDPIDGTNNFAHQIDRFGISVAYRRCGETQCGVIYSPLQDEWYSAERGQGALFNGQPMRVSSATTLNEVLLGVGFYYDRGAMMEATLAALRQFFAAEIHGVRRFGAATLDLMAVARGQFGGYFELELSPWDFAAGALIVTEAGGRVTTCTGASLPCAKTSLLASNGHLHDAMLEVLAKYDTPR